MAESDWTFLQNGLSINNVDRGATAGIVTPPGGGDFAYGFNSLLAGPGCVGLYYNGVNFAPTPKGVTIRGCIQRGPGGGPVAFNPMFFALLGGPEGNSVNDHCYMLGLSDEDPHRIVLRKGTLVTGIVASDGGGVLRASDEAFEQGTWLHLRLDAVVNDNGDVVLNVYRNDLDAHPVNGAATWTAIPGMAEFIDDHLGINSGTQPLTSGRVGFAFRSADVTRRGFFDHIEIRRQV